MFKQLVGALLLAIPLAAGAAHEPSGWVHIDPSECEIMVVSVMNHFNGVARPATSMEADAIANYIIRNNEYMQGSNPIEVVMFGQEVLMNCLMAEGKTNKTMRELNGLKGQDS